MAFLAVFAFALSLAAGRLADGWAGELARSATLRISAPLDQMAAFVTMDQLGRSLVDVTPGTLFLMGTESCAGLTQVLDELGAPKGGKQLMLGIDFQPGYSDYVPFKDRKLPYVFVTSGTCADYHAVTDTPDKLNYAEFARATEGLWRTFRQVAAEGAHWAP